MMNHIECTILVVKLNLKLQCKGQNYVIIETRKYLLKELEQSQTQEQQQTLTIKQKCNTQKLCPIN